MVQLNGKSPVTQLAATVCPVKVRYYHKNHVFGAGKYKLAILPIGKWLLPTGKQRFVCERFPHSEIALGKFQKKN